MRRLSGPLLMATGVLDLPYMKSSKSAAHLAAMCWSMEHGSSKYLPSTLKRWVDGPRIYERGVPPPPLHRGKLTVHHVLSVGDPDEYAERVQESARSAWEAWGEHHDQARAWVARALAEQRREANGAAVARRPDPFRRRISTPCSTLRTMFVPSAHSRLRPTKETDGEYQEVDHEHNQALFGGHVRA